MRFVGRFLYGDQVGFAVDSLKNLGFDRKDMVISNAGDVEKIISPDEAAEKISFIKTEKDGLWEAGSFAEGIKGLQSTDGIIVAVEASRHAGDIVRQVLEESGAVEIVQD